MTTFVHLFKEKASEFPFSIALQFDHHVVTYDQLDKRSDAIAKYLLDAGVSSGSFVVVYMGRCLDYIACMLGIMKVGAVYVPLDIANPPARIEGILNDIGEFHVVIDEHMDTTPFKAAKTLISVHEMQIGNSEEHPSVAVLTNPNAPGYLIYTSGSTGAPKGVLVSHFSLYNFALASVRQFEVGQTGSMLQFFPFSYDGSIAEIATALAAAAKLSIVAEPSMTPINELVAMFQKHRITYAFQPPALWSRVPTVSLPHLRTLILAGEHFGPDLPQRWAPGRKFYNAYGPTECTIVSTAAECVGNNAKVTIGKAIPNTYCYVIDERGQQVASGMRGELYVGGAGVAIGYLNRPELTAATFIADPFRPGEKIYKTGDMVRRCWDGNLEYVGRNDNQVKIRNYRVEPGEIESALKQYSNVEDCVVLGREINGEQKRLVAYVRVQPGLSFSVPGCKEFLKSRLPSYMIPEFFVLMETFPENANGKVYREKLPLPRPEDVAGNQDVAKPETPTEQQIAEIWKDVLKISDIGLHTNFFDIGGNSILLLEIHHLLSQKFAKKIEPLHLFEFTTIHTLAKFITEGDSDKYSEPIPAETDGRRLRRAAVVERKNSNRSEE